MSFLKINGYPIPVSAKSNVNHNETIIGERKQAFDATLLTSINNWRQSYDLETSYVTKEEADAIIGIVSGRGENWGFNESLYSGKGLNATLTRASVRYLVSASSVASGIAGYESGPYSNTITDNGLWIEEGTTNLLTENQATAASSNGFSAWGTVTLTVTTDEQYEGDTALKLEVGTTSLYQGFRLSNGTQDGGTYTFSVWMLGDAASAGNVFLSIYDGVTMYDSATFSVQSDGWVRHEVTGACTSGTIYGYVRNSDSGTVTLYCDCLQLE